MSEPELLHRDVHPAEVTIADEVVKDVRVFITSQRLLAYATREGHLVKALELALSEPCSVPKSRGTLTGGRLEVHLADGRVAWVNRGTGCGCGSPLKALAAPVPWS